MKIIEVLDRLSKERFTGKITFLDELTANGSPTLSIFLFDDGSWECVKF